MTFKKIGVALAMLVNFTASGQTTYKRLKDWGIPVAGEALQVDYQPAGGPLEGKDHLSGIIYLFNDYHWVIDDVKLQKEGSSWKGTFQLPANCAFLAVKFVDLEKGQIIASDNNEDQGYVSTTVNKRNVKLPGGNLAWGIFRMPSAHQAPQGYFEKFSISDEALEMWVRKEMQFHPADIPKFFDSYLAMLKLRNPDTFAKLADKNLKTFLKTPNLSEQGYQTAYQSYKFQLQDTHMADSIHGVILKLFPKGDISRLETYNQIYAKPLDEAKLNLMEGFLKDFPIATYKLEPYGSQSFTYYNIYRQLASAYFASNQNEKFFALVPDMDFATLNEIYRWNIDRIFALNRLPVERIYPVAHVLIEEMIKKQNDHSYMNETRYSPLQALQLAGIQFDNKLSIQIRLLDKMGKYTEALPYFKYITNGGFYSDAALNDAHVDVLEKTGKDKMVLPVLEQGIKANAATPGMIEKLKVIYLKGEGKAAGFDAYVESLKSKEDVQKTKAALKAKLINIPMENFKLLDMNGNEVKSENWKGKIVVIDFWATWCFPCKMAFPGMQLLVDRYAKDDQVGVYFLSTMEKSKSYKEDVKKYIQTSGYHFNVLYDDKNKKTGDINRVFKNMTSTFNSSAIPRKVVIKDGVIRYTAEGYGGSPSGLLDELSYVIEILKAE